MPAITGLSGAGMLPTKSARRMLCPLARAGLAVSASAASAATAAAGIRRLVRVMFMVLPLARTSG
jgi:hypothetical protein